MRHAAHGDLGLCLTGRAEGAALTPEGRAQAARLGRALRAEGLSEVRTSPRQRARETATTIAQAAGAPLSTEAALDEVDFGRWTGRSFASLEGDPAWDDWNRRRAASRPPGGEGMAEAADRVARHAESLAARRSGERIALVSHGDVIRALVARVLGLSLDNLLRFEVAPASVSRLEAGPGWARLLTLNETFPG